MVGHRKLGFSLAVVAASSILVWFTKIDGSVYQTIMVTVTGGYLTSNVWAKVQASKQA